MAFMRLQLRRVVPVTVPRGCAPSGSDNAEFKVQKHFEDGNDELATTLNISCNGGLPLEQTIEVLPNSGALGSYEVTFTVTDFTDGALDCDIWESTPGDYYASYECFSDGTCSSSTRTCKAPDPTIRTCHGIVPNGQARELLFA